jgi:hypothetical protein
MHEIFTGLCVPSSNNVIVYIDDFTTSGGVSNIDNTSSGYSTGGYGDFKAQSISGLYGTQTFDVAVSSPQYGGSYHFWVDWDNNLSFDNTSGSSEFVGSIGSVLSGTITVTIPTDQAAGDYVLRVVLNNSTTAAPDPCSSIAYGEFEDYTVSVIETPSCLVPDTLASSNITSVSADLSWNETGSATNHVVYVYDTGADPATATPVYTESISGSTTATATGLSSASTYDFYVTAVCPQGLGTTESNLQGTPHTFTTLPGCGDTTVVCYDNGTNKLAELESSGNYITVTFNEGDVEACCDEIFVYDTLDQTGNVLFSGTGDLTGQTVTSTTGIISVWMEADSSYSCSDGIGGPYTPISMTFTCAAPPACADASATMSAITATGATATWDAATGAASYDWEVVPTGNAQGVGVVDSGSGETGLTASITGLTSSTTYDFLISSDCTTDYASAVTFTTGLACGDTVSFCYAGGLVKHTELQSLGDFVTVTVNSGITESGYDDLVIFDSLDTSGNILYNTDGDHTGVSVTSTTGLISVWTNADGSWDCDDGLAGSVIEVTYSCVSPCNWTGATSSDWSDVSNWSTGAVPTSSDIVIIDGTFTNEPSISSSTDAAAISVSVATGNTLTIDETSSLTVSGDFTNTGTVTLNSTADDFSSLIVTGTATGNITYNRYVNIYDDSNSGGWDLVCSPVDMTIADFITANGANIEVLGDNYAFAQFNNATGQWERYATDNSDTGSFTSGQGYAMATSLGTTVAFTGDMQTTDQSINIINNDGLNNVGRRWNLVSNPFPSYIAGNTAAGATNFIDANSTVIDSEFLAVYGWNGSDYQIYNQLSGAFSMAPGQGFWVAALGTSDAALDFTAAMRTTTGTGDFVSGPQLLTYNVGLKLYNGEIERAATNFYFRDGLTLGLDPGYDAAAYNQSTKLSTRLAGGSQETAFAINAMAIDDLQNTRVPLEVRQNAGQAFTISISDMELPQDISVYLEDTLNGTLTSLKDGDFELTAQSNLSGADRFFIVFKDNSVLSSGDTLGINALNVYKANADNFVTIAGITPDLGKLNATLYNILGATVREKALNTATATQRLSTEGLTSGLYIIQLRSGNQVFTKKIIVE